MRKNCFSKRNIFLHPPPLPPQNFVPQNVGYSIKRKENMKWETKIQTSHQYKKLYSTPPWQWWHGAKFRENTEMRFRVTVRKLNVTDGQTDGGVSISPVPGLGNSIKREESTKWENILQINFFFKFKQHPINNKNYTAQPPWHGAHTCKVSRRYSNAFSSYSAKTKRDGQTDGWTDGQGAFQYLPSWAFGVAGDKNRSRLNRKQHAQLHVQCHWSSLPSHNGISVQ